MSGTNVDTAVGEPVEGCTVCDRLQNNSLTKVLETTTFTSYVSDVYPWAVMLATKRHGCDGPWSLTEDEAAEFGLAIRRLAGAMRAATSDIVYVLNFGEDIPMPHYHVGFFSRWRPISDAAHAAIYARTQETPAGPGDTQQFVQSVREQLEVTVAPT